MSKKRLLLAEDDEMLSTLLKFRLKKSGYEVDTVANGKEVMEYLNTTIPDLIISDIMMPYMSGLELVDYVRNKLNNKLPIIILSSAGNEENVLKAFEVGANDFLSKPVSLSELLIRVARELNKV